MTKRILWIEDEGLHRLKDYAYFIEKEGNCMKIVTNPKDARLELEKEDRYHLVILDLILPSFELFDDEPSRAFVGINLLKEIVNNYRYSLQNVVIFTVVTEPEVLNTHVPALIPRPLGLWIQGWRSCGWDVMCI